VVSIDVVIVLFVLNLFCMVWILDFVVEVFDFV